MQEKIITTDLLVAERESKINERQEKSVKNILYIMNHQTAAKEFYALLERYRGYKLTSITEKDRLHLIHLYPMVQIALAHADLVLENELTKILKQPGSKDDNPSGWDMINAFLTPKYNRFIKYQRFSGRFYGHRNSGRRIKNKSR